MNINKILLLVAIFLLSAQPSFVYSLYSPQCTEGYETGAQTDCTKTNDAKILKNQCEENYNVEYCTSMPTYLSHMAEECNRIKPEGIDCDTIPKSGIYGREASKYAAFVKENTNDTTAATQANAACCTETCTAPDSDSGRCDSGLLPDYIMSCDQIDSCKSVNYQSSVSPTSTSETGLSLPTEFGLPDAPDGIEGILTGILNWLLTIIGIIALIAFIISGLQYFLAAGDERIVETAKRNIMYSIIGIIVALSGFVIIQAIDYALNAYHIF